MATYKELKSGVYYLLQADAVPVIRLVSVVMKTKESVLLRSYVPAADDFFKLGSEPIVKLVEELDEKGAADFERVYLADETEIEAEEEILEEDGEE
ncbi:MAG TPA: hypothetical protein VGM41_10055 [Chitinophagaceae bacterium]|jgi:hypothetical protein